MDKMQRTVELFISKSPQISEKYNLEYKKPSSLVYEMRCQGILLPFRRSRCLKTHAVFSGHQASGNFN